MSYQHAGAVIATLSLLLPATTQWAFAQPTQTPHPLQAPVQQQVVPVFAQQPVYQQPVSQQPVFQPVYQQPVSQQPVFQPVYQQPVFPPVMPAVGQTPGGGMIIVIILPPAQQTAPVPSIAPAQSFSVPQSTSHLLSALQLTPSPSPSTADLERRISLLELQLKNSANELAAINQKLDMLLKPPPARATEKKASATAEPMPLPREKATR